MLLEVAYDDDVLFLTEDILNAWEVVAVPDKLIVEEFLDVATGSWVACDGCSVPAGHHRTPAPGGRTPADQHLSPNA